MRMDHLVGTSDNIDIPERYWVVFSRLMLVWTLYVQVNVAERVKGSMRHQDRSAPVKAA